MEQQEDMNLPNRTLMFANRLIFLHSFTEEDNTSSNYGVDLADEDTKAGDDRTKSPYGLHSLAFS